jgi:hypothetical protein
LIVVREKAYCGLPLERVLGMKTLENEILREALKLAHEKTDLALAVMTQTWLRPLGSRARSCTSDCVLE